MGLACMLDLPVGVRPPSRRSGEEKMAPSFHLGLCCVVSAVCLVAEPTLEAGTMSSPNGSRLLIARFLPLNLDFPSGTQWYREFRTNWRREIRAYDVGLWES